MSLMITRATEVSVHKHGENRKLLLRFFVSGGEPCVSIEVMERVAGKGDREHDTWRPHFRVSIGSVDELCCESVGQEFAKGISRGEVGGKTFRYFVHRFLRYYLVQNWKILDQLHGYSKIDLFGACLDVGEHFSVSTAWGLTELDPGTNGFVHLVYEMAKFGVSWDDLNERFVKPDPEDFPETFMYCGTEHSYEGQG